MLLKVECHAPERMDMVRPLSDTYREQEWDLPDSEPTEILEGGLTPFCAFPFKGRLSFWGQAPMLLTEECHAPERMDMVSPRQIPTGSKSGTCPILRLLKYWRGD